MTTKGGSALVKGKGAKATVPASESSARLSTKPAAKSKSAVKSKTARQDVNAAAGRTSAEHAGARLRARREASGVSLRQFARELGVSASFLSQLETGKAQPSVATLYSICTALNMSIDDLFAVETMPLAAAEDAASTAEGKAVKPDQVSDLAFSEDPSRAWNFPSTARVSNPSPLVTPSDRKALVLDSGVTWERLTAMTEAKIDFVFVRYDVGGSSNSEGHLTRHAGTEYGFVLRGVLEVSLGFETYRMTPGDAISYDSSTPHRLTNVGDVPVEAIWFGEGRNNGTH